MLCIQGDHKFLCKYANLEKGRIYKFGLICSWYFTILTKHPVTSGNIRKNIYFCNKCKNDILFARNVKVVQQHAKCKIDASAKRTFCSKNH